MYSAINVKHVNPMVSPKILMALVTLFLKRFRQAIVMQFFIMADIIVKLIGIFTHPTYVPYAKSIQIAPGDDN